VTVEEQGLLVNTSSVAKSDERNVLRLGLAEEVAPRATLSPIRRGCHQQNAARLPSRRDLIVLHDQVRLLATPRVAVIVLARTDLRADAWTIGLIFSVLSAGGIVGSLVAPRIATRVPFGTIVVGALATMTLAALLLTSAVVPAMVVLGGGLVVLAAAIYSIPQNAYRLLLIPDSLQGRVNSAFCLLFFGIEPLSMALTGVLLGLVGPRIVFVLIAAIVGVGGLTANQTSLRRATLS